MLAEQRLKTADGPGVAAGLNNGGHGEAGVEAARRACELDSGGEKTVGDEADGFTFEAERGGGEFGKDGGKAALHQRRAGVTKRGAGDGALDGAHCLVVGFFALALLARAEAVRERERKRGAISPCGD